MSNPITTWFGIDISENMWIAGETVPIILAFIAIIVLGLRLSKKPDRCKVIMSLAITACVLLIIAQSGWMSAHIQGIEFFKSIFDNVWTIFNCIVMTTYIMIGKIVDDE